VTIVVLDASPAFDGLDTEPLAALGGVVLHPSTEPEDTVGRIAGADIVLTNKVRLDAGALSHAPHLRLISVLATGYDGIDTAAATAQGITVCNISGYATAATAQTTIALLLELTQRVGEHSRLVHGGEWHRRGIWSFWIAPPVELAGKTLGIVGYGRIGQRVGAIAEALGMTVIPLSARTLDGLHAQLPHADVVSLHVPLTPQTRHLVDDAFLARLKPGALLINAARGAIVVDDAVAGALRSGHLGGYAADVVTTEPPAADNPLLTAPHCVLTPHLAWATTESRRRLLAETVDNLRAFQGGHPRNVVSGP
jgi:glycerate dehydrogenase